MSFKDLYALATEGSTWSVKQDYDVTFNWDYDDGRAAMMGLYAKGKEMQWDAQTRIDWDQELGEDNPEGMPEESLPIHMAPCYLKMSDKEKGGHPQAFPVVAAQPVHAGRAGRADLRRQDRHASARCRFQVLRRDPDHRRSAPCRSLSQAADQIRRLLSDHPAAQGTDRPDPARQPLGHDLSGHAGRDRGAGAGRLRPDPRRRAERAVRPGQRLCHAGRIAPRRLRPAGACAITIRI